LIADAFHIGEASGLGLEIDLDAFPTSPGAGAWCAGQKDKAKARLALATGGDDYAIVCAIAPARAADFVAAVESLAIPVAKIGAVGGAAGVRIIAGGRPIEVEHTGWRHSDRPENIG
jgi:thiamine-monophosphate kinase